MTTPTNIHIPLSMWEDDNLKTAEDRQLIVYLCYAEQSGQEPTLAWLAKHLRWPESFVAPILEDVRRAGWTDPEKLRGPA